MSVIVLGPCPCQGCGQLVTWNGWEWQNTDRFALHAGDTHTCRGIARLFGYNERDGSSVNGIGSRVDARSSATTRGAGVAAAIGVVDR